MNGLNGFGRSLSDFECIMCTVCRNSVQRGVSDETILSILRENGFQPRLAERLLTRTKREGRQIVERSYVDQARGRVVPIVS